MNSKNNIAIKIILGLVLVLILLSTIVGAIGFYQFTYAIEDQYADTAYHTAMTALDYIKPEFLKSSNKNLIEWQRQYQYLQSQLDNLVKSQEATYIYVFTAEGENHEDVVFLLNSTNPLYSSSTFRSGHKIKQTDARYLGAFRRIYDEKAERTEIAVYRPANDEYVTGNHITVMIPVKDSQSEVFAIIGVERRMEDLDAVRMSYLKHVMTVSVVFLLMIFFGYMIYMNKTVIKPVEKITKEKEQIQAELNVATQIQADMLPKNFVFPGRNEFEIFASMKPAKEVGGDFYDFFLIDEDHLAMVMADVSGKGVPAALFMVIAKTLIKNRSQMGGTPSEILHDVNNTLCEGNEAELFVTVWLGILELSTGKVIASNAGHEYPAIKHSCSGEYELLQSKNSPVVATFENMKFRQIEFELQAGDYIYLYTDGVAEATNSDNELYGTDRMIEALNKTENFSVNEILQFMKKNVDEFVGTAPQFDDITMLCLKYNGGEKIK